MPTAEQLISEFWNGGLKAVDDFKIALIELEPCVKGLRNLKDGREWPNFSLRPREAWGNWLLCAVLRKLHGDHITFAESHNGDGFIMFCKARKVIPVEHVSALEDTHYVLPKGENRVIKAINLKIKKGNEYAKGKWLVVFFDGAGKYFRNKIRENIRGRHNFGAIYCIGLLTSGDNGYTYAITEFKDSNDISITYKVEINSDFTDWRIFLYSERNNQIEWLSL